MPYKRQLQVDDCRLSADHMQFRAIVVAHKIIFRRSLHYKLETISWSNLGVWLLFWWRFFGKRNAVTSRFVGIMQRRVFLRRHRNREMHLWSCFYDSIRENDFDNGRGDVHVATTFFICRFVCRCVCVWRMPGHHNTITMTFLYNLVQFALTLHKMAIVFGVWFQ